jgi:hypothetical protein
MDLDGLSHKIISYGVKVNEFWHTTKNGEHYSQVIGFGGTEYNTKVAWGGILQNSKA